MLSGHTCDLPPPKAAEVGMFAVGYPEAYGGLTEGLDVWHGNIIYEELARLGAGGVGAALTVHGISLPTIAYFPLWYFTAVTGCIRYKAVWGGFQGKMFQDSHFRFLDVPTFPS